ncbi:MAG: Lpg1974 family pore-forming outer membrane protein [Pseudomonadota bacterium]
MPTKASGKLLATVAASAATVTSGGVVAAHATDWQAPDQTVVDSRIKLAFEGSYFWNNVHNGEKLGSDKLGNSNGDYSGSVALTKQISPDLDWRLAGAFHVGKDRSISSGQFPVTSPSDGTAVETFGDGFTFQTFDFDVGKHVKVQTADIRFFGGLRLVHTDETLAQLSATFTPTNPADKGFTADKIGTAEYWGIGPRVGAEAYYPVGEDWGLTGAVSGAVMWGRRTERLGFNVSNTIGEHASITVASQGSNETVSNLDASLGLSWAPVANTTFTAGYKIEAWHNLLVNADHDNQVFQGPFLRLEVKM